MMELVECVNVIDAIDVDVTKYFDDFEISCCVFLIPTLSDLETLAR